VYRYSVVRCIIADAEPPANLQKPFNAVLGETARHDIALAGGVVCSSVVEQVGQYSWLLNLVVSHRLQAPGYNPWTYKV
jgi:hypothetical protein